MTRTCACGCARLVEPTPRCPEKRYVQGHNGRRGDLASRFWPKVQKSEGCWLWTGAANRLGYGQIQSGPRGGGKLATHRVSYELSYGPIPAGQWVLHRCDTPGCVRPDHLFLGTVRDNVDDMLSKQRSARGERHSQARLNEEAIRDIRLRRKQGDSCTSIGAAYGIRANHVSQIVRGELWGHVSLD